MEQFRSTIIVIVIGFLVLGGFLWAWLKWLIRHQEKKRAAALEAAELDREIEERELAMAQAMQSKTQDEPREGSSGG